MNRKILVTGSAGFIGYHLVSRLIKEGWHVVGIDVINDFYDVNLKLERLRRCGIDTESIEYASPLTSQSANNYTFIKLDLQDKDRVFRVFGEENFNYVVNLAAQAGVRYSLANPYAYIDSNLYGFLNILEGCRQYPVNHLVFASSSSVYGGNTKMPFSVDDNVDHPISLYAATKKANELFAHTYSSLYDIPCTGLRFFTVYGPWGRPDMALYIFTKKIIADEPIPVFNFGKMKRDFTYIDDIIDALVAILEKVPVPNPDWALNGSKPSESFSPYRLFNIGNNTPTELMEFIGEIEASLGKKAKIEFLPMQPGDVPETYADIDSLSAECGFKPSVPVAEGVKQFVDWYRGYYRV